jgi:hypothetical protein
MILLLDQEREGGDADVGGEGAVPAGADSRTEGGSMILLLDQEREGGDAEAGGEGAVPAGADSRTEGA